jgi:predicted DNA-binding transcriptional regulator YafY
LSRIGSPESELRWSVERRLAFIEERLFWVGEVNRLDLVRRFGVSLSQASADIARYLALRPRVAYDKSAKRYVPEEDFRPLLAPPDAGRLLGELPLVELGVLAPADTLLGLVPPFSAAPIVARAVDAQVLRAVLRAIREARALDVVYQSMSRPAPARRRIEPHALVDDGFRWHVRGFDHETDSFRDFVFGRIAKPKLAGAAVRARADSDHDWQSFVALKIAPHPKLTAAQARAIALDYGMRGGSVTIRMRRALLFYALRRLGLDIPQNARPPHEQHIVLLNRAEIDAARATTPEA